MTTLAIIHTTPTTVDSLKVLAQQVLPGWKVINFVDDSVLPQLLENNGDLALVRERLIAYARFAESAGADMILEACSSVGEVVAQMREAVRVPVVRIDEAMAEKAVQRGAVIGVAATLPTTLGPTLRLLEEKARQANRNISFQPTLIDGAFDALTRGDRAKHDQLVRDGLAALAESCDAVVLAQASMAKVVESLSAELASRFLSSPLMGMERVRDTYAAEQRGEA